VLRDAHAFGAGIHSGIVGADFQSSIPEMGEHQTPGALAARWL
jgi:hypothetical protein